MAEKTEITIFTTAMTAQQKRAREFNVRCGENLFKVYSSAELEVFFMERLAGKRNIREVADVEVLRLSALDEEMIALILEENPDKIRVLGEDMSVSYQQGASPRVTITEQTTEGRRWLELPDEGIKLPSGRAVEIVLVMGWQTVANGRDVPALKEKVRGYLNGNQWSAWTTRPIIVLPNPAKDAKFPALLEVEYGKCVVTGVPLTGYGAVRVKSSRSYYDTSWFDSWWCQSADEARKIHGAAAVKFVELRVEALEKAERDEAKKAVAEVQARVKELYNDSRLCNSADSSLRGELYNRGYTGQFSSAKLADLDQWSVEARELIARAEVAIVEVDRRKAEKDRGRERFAQLLEREYAACPACGQHDSWTSAPGATCSCVEYESFDEDEVVFRESVAVDGRVLVRAELYRRRRSQNVHLNVLDEFCPELSEVTTRTVWGPPSEEERELKQQIQNAEYRLQDIARELDKCEGEYPTRILLKFEQDVSRGTLFAVANVHELSVFDSKSGESIVLTGSVRFVCDPTRCGWLNVPPPKAGESWVCSWGKMIGRVKSMPIVIANPQIQDDPEAQKAIGVEMKDIEAKIAALRGGSLVMKTASAEVSLEQSVITEPQGEVTQDALDALRAKFGK